MQTGAYGFYSEPTSMWWWGYAWIIELPESWA